MLMFYEQRLKILLKISEVPPESKMQGSSLLTSTKPDVMAD